MLSKDPVLRTFSGPLHTRTSLGAILLYLLPATLPNSKTLPRTSEPCPLDVIPFFQFYQPHWHTLCIHDAAFALSAIEYFQQKSLYAFLTASRTSVSRFSPACHSTMSTLLPRPETPEWIQPESRQPETPTCSNPAPRSSPTPRPPKPRPRPRTATTELSATLPASHYPNSRRPHLLLQILGSQRFCRLQVSKGRGGTHHRSVTNNTGRIPSLPQGRAESTKTSLRTHPCRLFRHGQRHSLSGAPKAAQLRKSRLRSSDRGA